MHRPSKKQVEQQKQISDDVEKFLAAGGTVKKLEPNQKPTPIDEMRFRYSTNLSENGITRFNNRLEKHILPESHRIVLNKRIDGYLDNGIGPTQTARLVGVSLKTVKERIKTKSK